jgi:hypothetical protein
MMSHQRLVTELAEEVKHLEFNRDASPLAQE